MKRFAATALMLACAALAARAQSTTPPTTDLYDEPHYERVARLIYGYQRLLSTIDDEARAKTAHAAQELGAHLARVSAEYDAIMHEHGDVPDARLDAALREVQAVSAEMTAWKQEQVQ